ncbi:hypothetical protein [Hymenobacter yonginensis]|uniref:DUF3592 domain-containing protein n=1 Tax=Hymenobacter yonginensis TaxID=748197 RepID=A0ABY7PKZ2_9BACT|nr:hypothetical protein [Hymenobacter yonginensis]WBO82958.1 hypothetical protein O9Z63_11255 [Hymenobacter yonginensis]
MLSDNEEKVDRYAFYLLIIASFVLVAFYYYDVSKFNAIENSGARVEAQVMHVQFLRNDWNTLLEYQYKGKWYIQHCLSTEEYHVGDTVVVKFELDKPEDRLIILGHDSIAHY